MGVDIYGLKPQLKYEKPEIDWSSLKSDKRKEAFESLTKFENDNPGYYFRSNWWGWRPLVYLSDIAIQNSGLQFDTEGWGENSGHGLKDGVQCTLLAQAIEYMIEESDDLSDDNDTLYINLGSWSNSEGGFVSDDIQAELSKEWPLNEVRGTQVVGSDGNLYSPSHSAPVWHIKNWINFLKECGGFEIY